MRRGFTLIELITTLVVMGIIVLITIPLLYQGLINSRQQLYNEQITKLLQAGKNWGLKNPDDLPKNNGEYLFMSPKDLAKLGFVDSEEIIDPRDNSEIKGCIVVKKENDKYDYKYEEANCSSIKGEYLIKFDDNINLKEKVEVNSTYQEQNVKATDFDGNELVVTGPTIKKSGTNEVVMYVDTSHIGDKYDLIYKTEDSNGNKKELKIEVTIVDTIAPEIVVQGKNKNFTYYYSTTSGTFEIPQATVTDNSGEVKQFNGKDYKVTSNVSSIVGTYKIIYEAEDKSGNKKKLTVTVVIDNTDIPIIKEVKGNPTIWQNKDVELTISKVVSKSKIVEYSFDDGETWQKTNKKTFDKNQTVKMKVKDQDGNESLTYEVGITKIDKTGPSKPIITLKKNNTGGEIIASGEWTNTDVVQIQTSKDEESGEVVYERSIDLKTWKPMEINAVETKEQEQNYYVRAKDNAGNVSEASDMYVIRIDKTPPLCGQIIVTEGTLGDNDWYISNIKLSYKNGSDSASGHENTVLNINEITNDTKGTEVKLTTTDKAGNKCQVSQTYKLDKTNPNCGSVRVTSGVGGNNGWYRSDITLEPVNGSDDMSGHASTTIDRNTIQGDTGGTGVNITTKDKAGNKCTTAQSFRIDKTPPTISIQVHNITHGTVYTNLEQAFDNFGIYCNRYETPGFIGVRYVGIDNLSGIEAVYKYHAYAPGAASGCGVNSYNTFIQAGFERFATNVYTHFLQCNSGGQVYIKAKACDNAGNCSNVSYSEARWNITSMKSLTRNKCRVCSDTYHCSA